VNFTMTMLHHMDKAAATHRREGYFGWNIRAFILARLSRASRRYPFNIEVQKRTISG
jgi:hypothetical protein